MLPIDVTPPDGFVYQWVNIERLGQGTTWTAVPADRHCDLFDAADLPADAVVIDASGLRLMERPVDVDREARRADRERAVRLREGAAPGPEGCVARV
jgi:hypothetical protein